MTPLCLQRKCFNDRLLLCLLGLLCGFWVQWIQILVVTIAMQMIYIPQPRFIFLQGHLIRDSTVNIALHTMPYCWLPAWCYAAIICINLAWLKLYNFWPHFLLLPVVATHHPTPWFCGFDDLRNLYITRAVCYFSFCSWLISLSIMSVTIRKCK